jgi:hypothetical protein
MLRFECLHETVHTGGKAFPIFIAFCKPKEILLVADVPSFEHKTAHSVICENISTVPVKEWQRPRDDDRVERVKNVFDTAGELMPNAILLCENPLAPNRYSIQAELTAGGRPTGRYLVEIPEPANGDSKPLWVLDGQHRITGLAHSKQSDSPVPTVLLLNYECDTYTGKLVAKLFAQVTTEAEDLDELHNEWLTFAFDLGDYDPAKNPLSQINKTAMRAVIELCKHQYLPPTSTVNNPFFTKVKFNYQNPLKPAIGPGPTQGGFNYEAGRLKELVARYYYSKPLATHLDPTELATQMAAAYTALAGLVQNPGKSVYFGKPKKTFQQEIMQDAFWVGVFAALAVDPAPDWQKLLKALRFDKSNWDFSWALGHLSGSAGSNSKRVAFQVFGEAFKSGAVPISCQDLVSCLKGENASIIIWISRATKKGGARKKDRIIEHLVHKDSKRLSITPAKHVRLAHPGGKTCNVGKIIVWDNESPLETIAYFRPKKLALGTDTSRNPLKLKYKMPHYGPELSIVELELDW